MNEDQSALSQFKGVARLFPLPNLVLFPAVIQPLHIFEPRYRQMTADALADDRLIAIVLLQAGWEGNYEGRPRICPVACLGRIVADQRLPDGRYNLLVRGLSRLRVAKELKRDKLYRTAQVELMTDSNDPVPKAARAMRRQLARLVTAWVSGQEQVMQQFLKLLKSDLALGVLCDIFAFALPIGYQVKQELLELTDVEQRAQKLLTHLENREPEAEEAAEPPKFPPEFSQN